MAAREWHMLDVERPVSEDERIERVLDDAAERLAEVLIAHWEYQAGRRRKTDPPSGPLARRGAAR